MCHNGPVISRQESKNQYASFALSVLQDNQKKGTKSHVYHNQESKNIYKFDKLQKKKKILCDILLLCWQFLLIKNNLNNIFTNLINYINLYKFYYNKYGCSKYSFKNFISKFRSSPFHFEMKMVHLKNMIWMKEIKGLEYATSFKSQQLNPNCC